MADEADDTRSHAKKSVRGSDNVVRTMTRMSVSSEDEFRYNMSHTRRGQFVIINQKTFSDPDLNKRRGTDIDRDNLFQCFTEMGFRAKSYTNLTCRQMMKVMNKLAAEDHSDADCICCAFLSHGEEGIIHGTDGKIELETLFSPFKNCDALLGKPKIFIVQACRGEGMDVGGVVQADAEPVQSTMSSCRKIPLECDYLYVYSSPPGFRSFRNTEIGSYFIQALCDILTKYRDSKDIMWMLTRVNYKLAYEFESRGRVTGEGMKQVSSFVSMLTKELYFNDDKTDVASDEDDF